MKRTGKIIGSVMMVLGSIVGSGMLALPLVASRGGFISGLLFLIITWLINTLSGYLLVDLNFTLPAHASGFSSMSHKFLGKWGKNIIWLGYLLLLYSLLIVAIIGESNILLSFLHQKNCYYLSYSVIAFLFTVLLGSAVFWSTAAVDYLNRGLVAIKGIALFCSLLLIFPMISAKRLSTPSVFSLGTLKYSYLVIPSFMSAFCFQFIIPSLRIYLGENKKVLKKIILFSTTIALVVYVWWLAACLGVNLPSNSLPLYKFSVGDLNHLLAQTVNHPLFTSALNFFTNITLTTAFLGAALSLFDFIAENMRKNDTHWNRFKVSLLTFLPPLMIALFFPNSFVTAVNYAALFVIILCIILPLLMIKKLSKNPNKFSIKEEITFSSFKIDILLVSNLIILIVNLWCILYG